MPSANSRVTRSNLRTDDMERWKVELRMTLDREHRRFHKANEIDYFDQLLKAKLSEQTQVDQQQHHQQGLSLNLSRLDDAAFNKLDNFLKTFMGKCPSVDEQNKLHKVLRDLLIELKQELYRKETSRGGCVDPYCIFCGISIQNQRLAIANEPASLHMHHHHQNNYTPNVDNAMATPPPSAAPTPDEGPHNHSMQRLQSQFNNSFTSKQNNGARSATPPFSPSAMAALRLRQNQEAQRAVDEAGEEATSQSNASPMGFVNLNQQPNGDGDEDADLDEAEVASVRDMVRHVDRVMTSPVRGQQRCSTPLSSSDSSLDLVMDVSADASASQTSSSTPTSVRIKKMREEHKRPKRGARIKKGGPKRQASQRPSNPL